MNTNKKLVKTSAAALFAIGGVAVVNATTTNTAHAATITANTASVVTTKYNTTVFNSADAGRQATGQVLGTNTHWKVIKTAINNSGEKWLDLGKNQWVKATDVVDGYQNVATQTPNSSVVTQASNTSAVNSVSSQGQQYQQVQQQYQQVQQRQSLPAYNNNNTGNNYSVRHTTNTNYAAATGSSSEQAALNFIASKESGGSYTARNQRYYGKYQLDISYLHGDLSPQNQERVARQYAVQRYGSVAAAARFRATHNYW